MTCGRRVAIDTLAAAILVVFGLATPGAGAGPVPDGGATAVPGAPAGGADGRTAAASPPVAPESLRFVDKRPYFLLGAGVRRKPAADLYAIALYVDEVGARRAFPALASRAGGRTRDKLLGGDKAPPFVVWGDFGKLAVVRLERDLPLAELRGIFEEGLEAQLGERAPPELRQRAQALLAIFERDGRRGDVIEISTTPGGLVTVRLGEVRREVATDARLARALWEIWLGARPVQVDLRRALIDRIDQLGR